MSVPLSAAEERLLPTTKAQPTRLRQLESRKIGVALLPAAVVLVVAFGLPLVLLLRASFSDWPGFGEMTWVGLRNFADVLGDGRLGSSLVLSFVLGASAALGITAVALVLAALVSGGISGAKVYRIVWFLPAIAPPAAVAVFWSLSVQPETGVVNSLLAAVGLDGGHAWLGDPTTAMYVVIAVLIWQGVGFAFLVLLGAMEDVPVAVYEAASLDGCGPMRKFWAITLPLIRPVLSMIMLLEAIWAFNGFTLVWGLTRGGPGDSTTILPVLVYKEAFQFGNFGAAAAISIVGGVILLVLGLLSQRIGGGKGADG